MIVEFWLACQLTVLGILVYALATKDMDWTGENLAMMGIMLTFGPLALSMIFGLILHERMQSRIRSQCAAAMAKWESKARVNSNKVMAWDWYMNPKQKEERYNLLRTAIRTVSQKDLERLLRVGKNTFDVDGPIKEAIVDELIERKILSHE